MPDIWMDVDAALSEVPINSAALIDDTDFKAREESVVYNQGGLDLLWNFVTTAGAFSQTAVTPTDTAGDYDWVGQGNGLYTIEIPASGGGTINNDTEGFGWFTGYATGILPWRGPIIGFRAAAINNSLVDGSTVDVNVTAMAANVVTAAAIANAAIDNATFAADVGSTAHGTNIIALAVRKILEELNLDHLLKVDTTVAADGDLEDYCVAGTVMGHLLSTSADATLYKASTDSMQAIRDHIGDGTNLTEAGGDGDHLDEAGGTGDHLTAINLPNQTMDITGNITGNLSGSVGTCAAATVSAIGANVITATSINGDAITSAKIADDAIAAEHLKADAVTKIIDDFETQSQADPTGFHVNVKEVNGTAQTAADIGSKTGYALSAAGIDSIRTEPLTDAETLETIGGMIHAIYCSEMQKQTVTDSARVIYKLDDTTALRTQTLADDDTTVTRGGG